MSINIDQDYIDVFLLHNNIKVKSTSDAPNYYRIITKDIGVKEDFQELEFTIVNDIKLKISIKFKNKFSTKSMSLKDRLSIFNQAKKNTNENRPAQVIPKKIKMPNFLRDSMKSEEQKKAEEIKKKEEAKNKDKEKELKQTEETKNPEENKEPEKTEEEKNIEENKEPEKTEEIKNVDEVKEPETKEETKNVEEIKEPEKIEETKNVEEEKEPEKIEETKNVDEDKETKEENDEKEKEDTNKEEEKEEQKEEQKEENKEEIKEENKEENNEPQEEKENIDQKEEDKNEENKIEENKTEENKLEDNKIEETKKEEKKIEETKKEEKKKEKKSEETKKEKKSEETKKEKKIEEKKKEKVKLSQSLTFTQKDIKKGNLLKTKDSSSSAISDLPLSKATTTSIAEEDDEFVVLDFDDLEEERRQSSVVLQKFLEPKKYSKYLDEQKKKGIKHPYRETFCEGFFIASFPKKDGKVIEMSNSFKAQCKHPKCTILPAMKPEIIFRYPLQDTKTLELNNLAATICFPTGIKVCYDEDNGPNAIKDYVTSITNQKGERYYMMNYHFYLKMSANDYSKNYEVHPLKYHFSKFLEIYTGLGDEEITGETEKQIQDNLELCEQLGYIDTIFIPYCICLISKYPYVQEMKQCLQSIYTIIKNEEKAKSDVVINDLIMYLINAIPIPAKDTRIKFLLPYFNNTIDLECPKLDDINIMNLSASSLLKHFSIENLIIIFKLLISEKKILLIDNDYERLSTVADGLVSILYPFNWVHTYIPIMSDQMLKYLETFLPFLNGINESLMPLVTKVFTEGEMTDDDEVFLIYIRATNNQIRLSSSLKGKNIKLEKYLQDYIPPLPSSLEKELRNKLKKAKYELDDIEKNKKKNTIENKQACELNIRDAFIDLFVEMFQDYASYLRFVEEEPVFNKSLYLEKKSNNEKKFYNEILDTQLFQQFTQNVVKEGMNYFNNKITLHEQGKNKKTTKRSTVSKEYYINPGFLNLSKEGDNTNLRSLIKNVKSKYPEMKFNKSTLILEKQMVIEEKKYNEKDCQVYFTPEELESKKEPEPLAITEDYDKNNKRKMTNNFILQRIKAMNLTSALKTKEESNEKAEKEQESIKEEIKDLVIKIFKSEQVNLEKKESTELYNKLNKPFARKFFIGLLTNNSSNVVLLKEHSAHLLWTLINESILNTLKLEETDAILEEAALLIISSNFYGTQEEGATKTLFEKYMPKIQQFSKIKQDNFWQKWYDIELKKNDKNKDDPKIKQNIIYDICEKLIQLQLPKSLVKNLSNHINEKEFGKGSELQQETFHKIIEKITSAKYISSAI